MKIKPTRKLGRIIIELDRNDSLPISEKKGEAKTDGIACHHILVPIDFSECSKKALVYALRYAEGLAAEITLLYVAQFHYAGSEIGSAEAVTAEREHLNRAKIELMKLAREIPGSIQLKTKVVSGKPFQEIVSVAEALNSDMIIIGTHGRTGLKNDYLGSTAERVIRYANCPVLVVRERERDFISQKTSGKAGKESPVRTAKRKN